MESFAHSKTLRKIIRRQNALRKIKIGALVFASGAFTFFVDGGMANPVWASLAGSVVAGIAGAAAQIYFD